MWTAGLISVARGSRPITVFEEAGKFRTWLWTRTEYRRARWSPVLLAVVARAERVRVVHVHDDRLLELGLSTAERLDARVVVSSQASVQHPTRPVDLLLCPTHERVEAARGLGIEAARLPQWVALADEPMEPGGDGLVRNGDRLVEVLSEPWSAEAADHALRVQLGRTPVVVADPRLHELVPEACRAPAPTESAEVARRLVGDPAAHAAASAAARSHVVRHHASGSVAADLDDMYRSLVAGRAIGRQSPMPALPSVSVVMSTYNRAALLPDALQALEQQTYPAELLEFVVVDNGSTDTTAAVLDAWAPRQAHVVIRNEQNTTPAEARNRAVGQATGDVIAFTDDDCVPERAWLEALAAGFRDGVGIVQGLTRPTPGVPQGPLTRSQSTQYEYGLYETCNIAYRRSALPADGPFLPDVQLTIQRYVGSSIGNQAFGEDVDLAWRVKRAGAGSRFAADAVVNHHVFPSDPLYLWRRAALVAGFPVLISRFPELRAAFLWRRVLLGRHRLFIWLALLGLLSLTVPVQVALFVPWLWHLVRPHRSGWRGRLKALPVLVVRDLIETAALVYGSARARSLVL